MVNSRDDLDLMPFFGAGTEPVEWRIAPAQVAYPDAVAEMEARAAAIAAGEAPEGFATTGSPAFNRLWTMSGAPCINVTGLTGATGLPIGVQLVGRFGRDRALLEAARFLERAIGA